MAEGRLAPAPFSPPEYDISAPNYGADFLINQPGEIDRPAGDLIFDRQKATLLINLGGPELINRLVSPEDLAELYEYGFKPKEEIHITVLGYDNGTKIRRKLDGIREEERRAALQLIDDTASELDWSWSQTGAIHPFQRRSRGNVKVISLIDCPAAPILYDRLETQLPGLELERYPIHITMLKKPYEKVEQASRKVGGIAVGRPFYTLGEMMVA